MIPYYATAAAGSWSSKDNDTGADSPTGAVPKGRIVAVDMRDERVFRGKFATRKIWLHLPLFFPYGLLLFPPPVRRHAGGDDPRCDSEACGFCGTERHPYELYLDLNDIEHRRTKVRNPKTNGFVQRFYGTVPDEFFRVKMRETFYESAEPLQADLDTWLHHYNTDRPHLGNRNRRRRPIETINPFVSHEGLEDTSRFTKRPDLPKQPTEMIIRHIDNWLVHK